MPISRITFSGLSTNARSGSYRFDVPENTFVRR